MKTLWLSRQSSYNDNKVGLDPQHPSAKPTVAMKPMQLYIGNNRVRCLHPSEHSDVASWPSASHWRPRPDVRGQQDRTSIINPISGLNYYSRGGKTAVSHNQVSWKLNSLWGFCETKMDSRGAGDVVARITPNSRMKIAIVNWNNRYWLSK